MMTSTSATPVERVLDALSAAGSKMKQARSGQWTAQCPNLDNHRRGDKNPSLSIAEGSDGKAILHCHSGCTLPDVAHSLGLGLSDLFPDRPPSVAHITGGKRIKATYDYYSTDGTLVFQVVRFDPKTFRQRQPDNNGGWVWNLDGITTYPLYHAPQVVAGLTNRRQIWVVEGEKDAEALQWEVDGPTTCNSGGALSWRYEHTTALAGAAHVNIVADDDAKGWEHARAVAGQLTAAHIPTTVWAPPEQFNDVAEALGAGKTPADFRRIWTHTDGDAWLTEQAPATEVQEAVELEQRNDRQSMLIDWAEFWSIDHGTEEWIAWPLIPAQRQVALYAPAKTGKSIITLAACAAVATGRSVFGADPTPPRHVLYLDYEMTASDLQERLESLGYDSEDDLSHFHYALLPSLPPLNTTDGCRELCALAAEVDAEVVVIDTMGRAVTGEENSADSYREFARTTGLALKAAGRAVLRTDHAGKDKEKGQRGTSAKNDDVDVVLRVDAVQGGWSLTRTHTRVSWVPAKTAIERNDTEGVTTFTVNRSNRVYAVGTQELVERMRALGITHETARREASNTLKANGGSVRASRLSDALAWMRAEAPKFTDLVESGREPRAEPTYPQVEEPCREPTGTTLDNTCSEGRNHNGNHAEPDGYLTGNQFPPLKGNRSPEAVPHSHSTSRSEGLFDDDD